MSTRRPHCTDEIFTDVALPPWLSSVTKYVPLSGFLSNCPGVLPLPPPPPPEPPHPAIPAKRAAAQSMAPRELETMRGAFAARKHATDWTFMASRRFRVWGF